MKKSLAQKITPYIFVGLSLIAGGCGNTKTLDIGSSKVSYKVDGIFIPSWNITERKSDGTKIKYSFSNNLRSWYSPDDYKITKITLERIKINNEEYSTEDTAVFNRAEKKMKFLIDRYYFVRDSTRQAKGLKALQ